jgi:hypothetical protein
VDIEKLISAAHRSRQADEHQTANRSLILHMAFFFDGTYRNIKQGFSEQHLSNTSRLFRTCPGVLKNKITKICSNFISPVPAHRAQNA